MFTVEILEDEDVITEGCFVRQQALLQEGWSDSFLISSTYGGKPINSFRWLQVERATPAWIGKKVKKYRKKGLPGEDLFCKAKLPLYMITPLNESEYELSYYKEYLRNLIIPFGKHKGLSALEISGSDSEYFIWLNSKTNFIVSLSVQHMRYLDKYYENDKLVLEFNEFYTHFI